MRHSRHNSRDITNRPNSMSRSRSASKNRVDDTDVTVVLTDSFMMKQKVDDVASKLGRQTLNRASNDLN